MNGQPTFISYVSPTQLNVQIPANVPTGEPLPVVVSFRGVSSNPVMLRVVDQAGRVARVASFKVGDKQYVVGVRQTRLIANGIPDCPKYWQTRRNFVFTARDSTNYRDHLLLEETSRRAHRAWWLRFSSSLGAKTLGWTMQV
jgi:hypothetical protein